MLVSRPKEGENSAWLNRGDRRFKHQHPRRPVLPPYLGPKSTLNTIPDGPRRSLHGSVACRKSLPTSILRLAETAAASIFRTCKRHLGQSIAVERHACHPPSPPEKSSCDSLHGRLLPPARP